VETPQVDFNALLRAQNPRSAYEAELIIRRWTIPWVREFKRGLSMLDQLTPQDEWGLTVFALGRKTQAFTLERGMPVKPGALLDSTLIACRTAVVAFNGPEPIYETAMGLMNRMEWFFMSLASARDRQARGVGSPRDQDLAIANKAILEVTSLPRDTQQYLGIGRMLAQRVGQVRDGERCNDHHAAAIIRTGRAKLAGWGDGFMLNKDGVFQVGPWQMRDAVLSAFGEKRVRKKKAEGEADPPNRSADAISKMAEAVDDPTEFSVADVEVADDAALNALEATQQLEELDRLRAAIAREKARLRPGSVAADIADYLIPFTQGEMSLAEVAAATGRSEQSAHRELLKVGARVARGMNAT
jgi:hypothetical protein